MERFSNGAILKWSDSQMERFSNGAILKWSNSQMERFGVATLCHISRSQEQRNMACNVLTPSSSFDRLCLASCLPPDLLQKGNQGKPLTDCSLLHLRWCLQQQPRPTSCPATEQRKCRQSRGKLHLPRNAPTPSCSAAGADCWDQIISTLRQSPQSAVGLHCVCAGKTA